MSERTAPENPMDVARGRRPPGFLVVDDNLQIVFSAVEHEKFEGGALPPGLESVLLRLKPRLIDSEEASATAVLSPTQVVRLVRLETPDGGTHFAVFLERFGARNAVLKAKTIYNLSERETKVLEGLMRGDSTKDIARRLGIGSTTVREHIRKIGRKTNVTKRTAIVATVFALR